MRFPYRFYPVFFLAVSASCLAVSSLYAGGYPHFLQNGLDCSSCHNVQGGLPNLIREQLEQTDIDFTLENQLCWSCHNDSDAVAVQTHSSLQTSNTYGNWTIECATCHDPHFQLQAMYYPNDYIAQGVIASADATTLTKTGAADWTPDAYKGMILFPNKNLLYFSYLIVSNTADTLTVDPDVTTPQVDGSMDLSQALSGNTFMISYGKLIRKLINPGFIKEYSSTSLPLPEPTYPKSGLGLKEVKFIRSTGTNSFADGDATINGICEVCHTQTTHWRNDGTLANIGVHAGLGGGNCVICHKHTGGFKPFNHLAEGVVAPAAVCIVCHVTDHPVADVHVNDCSKCHTNSQGGGLLVGPTASNTMSGGQCNECHTGNHDEIPHIATPPDDWVQIWDANDHHRTDGRVLVVCSGCHTADVKVAHAQYCSNCHKSPVDSLGGSWAGGCQEGGCHTSYHAASNTAHLPYDSYCDYCHGSRRGTPSQDNCSNCHAAPTDGPPVTSSDAKATYYGAAAIHLSVSIGSKVGIAFTFYKLDGGEAQVGSDVIVIAPGVHTLEFWSVDQSGQEESTHKTATFTVN